MNVSKISTNKFIGWGVYGFLTSLFVYYLFPTPLAGGMRLVLVLGVFLFLGGIDYLTSKIIQRSK